MPEEIEFNPELARLIFKNQELAYILIVFGNLWHSNYKKPKEKDKVLIQLLKYLDGYTFKI